jgi:radical SAM superfamily enzyme YgiQ (UPF0313 family)
MVRKKILFIHAVNPDSEIENRYKPLWPCYLKAFFERKNGTGKVTFALVGRSVFDDLKRFQPDVVAIGGVSQNFGRVKTYARLARESGARVIVGGIHISSLPGCLNEDMDVGVIGEGEAVFAQLLEIFCEQGTFAADDLRTVPGVTYQEQGVQRYNTPVPDKLPLTELPHPDRSLIGYQKHDYLFSSRGCPYRCSFCASSRFWETLRFAPAEQVLEEIEELVEHGTSTISFYDDLFVADLRRCAEIAEGVARRGLSRRVKFTCSCRANHVKEELMPLLQLMNVVSVGMGLESGSDRVLKRLKGGGTAAENAQAIEILKSHGIQANASFVIGEPEETLAEMRETYHFIRNSRLDFFDVYVLTPYPGTPVWEEAAARGLVSESMDWERLRLDFERQGEQALILNRQVSPQTLLRCYQSLQRLRFFRILRALPTSPWLADLPAVAFGKLRERWAASS